MAGTQEATDLSEERYQEWKRRFRREEEELAAKIRGEELRKERQQEGTLSILKGRKEEEGPHVPRTVSNTIGKKGKEMKDHGTQNGDIRNETWKNRPEETNLPTPPKKRIRNRSWKKIQESSRKLSETNIEERLSDAQYWKPTPVLDFLIDTGATKSYISNTYFYKHLKDVKLTPHYVHISAVNGDRMNV